MTDQIDELGASEEITAEAKIAADVPNPPVAGAENLPADVEDGTINDEETP